MSGYKLSSTVTDDNLSASEESIQISQIVGNAGQFLNITVSDNSARNPKAIATTNGTEDNNSSPVVQFRASTERPIYKLSVRLIDTYKFINKVYYEAKALKLKGQKVSSRSGVNNDGFDDQNFDYILQGDEIINERYLLRHRMGKGSFGQVVCAFDNVRKCEVAIKIIKSRKPFLLQAKTEIEILNKILEKDENDDSNIVRLLDSFLYRNHQCIVFEILSFNLYDLLKNTKFRGVSLSLIRKFSRSLVKALEFLARPDVNIIHCDLKPENILLKHPRRSAIKLIDFGSSCYHHKKTYSYIQSRFYRSPEVILGLSYTNKIDMWSFGCVAVEMHTGEPLFGGANQLEQMCRIVDVLGMPPLEMIKESPEKTRSLFFERIEVGAMPPPVCDLKCVVYESDRSAYYALKRPNKDMPKPRKLQDILGVYSGGPHGLRSNEQDHSPAKYEEFVDFIQRALRLLPEERASASEIAQHPYLTCDQILSNFSSPQPLQQSPPPVSSTVNPNNSNPNSNRNRPLFLSRQEEITSMTKHAPLVNGQWEGPAEGVSNEKAAESHHIVHNNHTMDNNINNSSKATVTTVRGRSHTIEVMKTRSQSAPVLLAKKGKNGEMS